MITSAWTKRHTITIDHTKVTTGDHTDFPIILVNGNFLDDCYTVAKSDGSDIRFSSDEGGANELAFEIVSWNQGAKTSEVWVKIPTLSSATDVVIYVWYGNAAATAYSHTDTYGTHAVWSNNFQGVYHLEANGNDSSPNSYNMTKYGNPGNVTVKNGKGFEFYQNAADYFEVTGATNLNVTNETISCWGRSDADGDGGFAIGQNNNCGLRCNNFGDFRFNCPVSGITGNASVARDANLNFIAGTYAPNSNVVYKNKTTNTVATSGTAGGAGTTWWLGKLSGTNWPLDGLIDEVHIVSVARSTAWLNTEYDNQNAPLTFSAGSNAILYTWGGAISILFI